MKDRSTVMRLSQEWHGGVVDSAMQSWTPHDEEKAAARTGLHCEDAQGSGMVDRRIVLDGGVGGRPFSAHVTRRATPEAAKAASGDLKQRREDYTKGFEDGSSKATGLVGKAWTGLALKMEKMSNSGATARKRSTVSNSAGSEAENRGGLLDAGAEVE